jgi:arylsulfatase A-like enzyme
MPHTNGVIGLVHRGFRMHNVKRHLSHLLKDAGYRTALIGFQHEVPASEVGTLGYDQIIRNEDLPRHSVERGKVASDWLNHASDEPFFLNVGLVETHRPFSPVESPDDERYVFPLPYLPDDPEVRRDVAELHTAVRHVDEGVGLILDAMDKKGLTNKCITIFTTDHGVPFPRAKATLFDAGIGVAFIMRAPRFFAGGQVVDALFSQIDLLPTLFEFIGIPIPADVQGLSFAALLTGRVKSIRDHIVAEITYHAAYDPARSIRTTRHKYIRYFEDRPRWVLPNVDNGLTKSHLMDLGLPIGEHPREMLFDLAADPGEFENLVGSLYYTDTLADLRRRLDNWMERTDDPIRHGQIPPPPGSIITPHDAVDPEDTTPAQRRGSKR